MRHAADPALYARNDSPPTGRAHRTLHDSGQRVISDPVINTQRNILLYSLRMYGRTFAPCTQTQETETFTKTDTMLTLAVADRRNGTALAGGRRE